MHGALEKYRITKRAQWLLLARSGRGYAASALLGSLIDAPQEKQSPDGRSNVDYAASVSLRGCCACIQSAACCALLAAVKMALGSSFKTLSHEAT